jgi:hypothetical protein
MTITKRFSTGTLILALTGAAASAAAAAGVLDSDCTAQKAAKGAAAKATVGVGGRCSPVEAAKDTAMRAADGKAKASVDKVRGAGQGTATKTAPK